VSTSACTARHEYSAIGTVVNLAARLCAEAEAGQILIDPKVQSAVESLAEIEPAGELTLKGLSRPIKAFKVGALREVYGRHSMSPTAGPVSEM
jgi:adenylate cyclase